MQIINRYLIKEVLQTFIAVMLVLLLILISGQLVSLYTKAAAGSLGVKLILLSLTYKTIGNLVLVVTLSLYLAIILVFSRLYKDNEMTVLSACSVSTWQIIKPVLILATLCMISVGWLSFHLAPWAESRFELLTKQSAQTTDIEALGAGRFRELPENEGVVYVKKFDEDTLQMQSLFVQRDTDESQAIITAGSGYRKKDEKTGDKFLVLKDGYRYEGRSDQDNYTIVKFKEHGIRLDEQVASAQFRFRIKAESSILLWQRRTNEDIAEMQWRASVALLCVFLALLAVPLSRTTPRQGRYAKLALAILVYLIYNNLLQVSRAWLNKGEISPLIGMWWVHLLAFVLALLLLVRWRNGWRRLVKRGREE